MQKDNIKQRVLINQKYGQPFAFMIDIKEFEQFWIVVMFVYNEFPQNCSYFVEKQLLTKNDLKLIEEKSFQNIDDLMLYLSKLPIDSNYTRAIH